MGNPLVESWERLQRICREAREDGGGKLVPKAEWDGWSAEGERKRIEGDWDRLEKYLHSRPADIADEFWYAGEEKEKELIKRIDEANRRETLNECKKNGKDRS